MPVYNGKEYLALAVESILRQTFADFEFIIINDGSTDNSADIAASYEDPRIKLLHNDKNLGLIPSFNRGLENSRGEYIARMDADDIAFPDRFKKQVAFLDDHPDIALCGSWAQTIGMQQGFVIKPATDHETLKANLLFRSTIIHPTVMMRRSILNKFGLKYDMEDLHFEDYGLWTRMSECAKLANLPEVLLYYRMHQANVSHTVPFKYREGTPLKRKTLGKLGISPNEKEMRLHNSYKPENGENTQEFIKGQETWLRKIIDANIKKKIYNKNALAEVSYLRFRTVCGTNTSAGLNTWKQFVGSPLFHVTPLHILDATKIFIKCLLKK